MGLFDFFTFSQAKVDLIANISTNILQQWTATCRVSPTQEIKNFQIIVEGEVGEIIISQVQEVDVECIMEGQFDMVSDQIFDLLQQATAKTASGMGSFFSAGGVTLAGVKTRLDFRTALEQRINTECDISPHQEISNFMIIVPESGKVGTIGISQYQDVSGYCFMKVLADLQSLLVIDIDQEAKSGGGLNLIAVIIIIIIIFALFKAMGGKSEEKEKEGKEKEGKEKGEEEKTPLSEATEVTSET